MIRTLFTLAAGIGVGVTCMAAAEHGEHGKDAARAIAARDIVEKLDGKAAKVTFVEVTYEAGQAGKPHRHPGPVFVVVVSGGVESALDGGPVQRYQAGDAWYEAPGQLHRVTRNVSDREPAVLVAWLLSDGRTPLVTPQQ